jgi:hypothetical protein
MHWYPERHKKECESQKINDNMLSDKISGLLRKKSVIKTFSSIYILLTFSEYFQGGNEKGRLHIL